MLGAPTKHVIVVSIIATIVAAAVVIVLAVVTGVSSIGHAFAEIRPSWLIMLVVAETLTVPAYLLSYRAILGIDRRPPRLPVTVWLVLAGFGPFAIRGGFALDHAALCELGSDGRSARVRVLAVSAVEWAVLAPAAWVASIVLLVSSGGGMGSLLWPWAVITPIGIALGLWATAPERDLAWIGRGRLRALEHAVDALRILHRLLRHPLAGWRAWLGTIGYWVADIAALYAACRLFGLRIGGAQVIVAYGTGYVITRRALPIAGAGLTEFLLTYALHWVGEPLAPALAAVIAYRMFNLVLATTPALLAHRRLDRWLTAPDPTSS